MSKLPCARPRSGWLYATAATAVLAARPIATAPRSGVIVPPSDSIGPPHRRHHGLAYDPRGRRVLVYGGQQVVSNSETPVLDDLWSWDGSRWTRVAASTGIALLAHKLFVDTEGVIFATADRLGLTSRWDGRRWVTVVGDSATAREAAAGAYDSGRRRFVLFGGHVGGRTFPRDTWEFDGHRWVRVATDGPPPMLGGAMGFDSRRRVSVLFGGLDSGGRKLGDTWEWDGARWTLVATSGPPARFGAGIAYDEKRGETIIFGGVDSTNKKLDDTWRWDGTIWRRARVAGPPARSEGYLAYDASRAVTVLFGGEPAELPPTLGDTWEWDGTRWRAAR